MRRLVTALGLAVSVMIAGGISGAGNGTAFAASKSGVAKACQQGGYLTLQTSTGQTFASSDACVSYAAQGGALFHPTITIVRNYVYYTDSVSGLQYWEVDWTSAGFHPNSTVSLSTHYTTSQTNTDTMPTDGNGSLYYPGTTQTTFYYETGCPWAFGPQLFINIVDASGVHASTVVNAPC